MEAWDLLMWAVLIGAWFAAVAYTGKIAEERGRSRIVWMWLSAFFGPIAIAFALMLEPKA
jgi:hypothetical protein